MGESFYYNSVIFLLYFVHLYIGFLVAVAMATLLPGTPGLAKSPVSRAVARTPNCQPAAYAHYDRSLSPSFLNNKYIEPYCECGTVAFIMMCRSC